MLNRALFLDRDGIINEDKGYVYLIDEFKFIPGIFELVRLAKLSDYYVIVVTNQAGIGRGYYTENDFQILNSWMLNEFEIQNAPIDGVYHCPFHPVFGRGKYLVDSDLRKPNPGMLFQAAIDFKIDLMNSIIVGDKLSDVMAGKNAGIKTRILVDAEASKDNNNNDYILVSTVKEALIKFMDLKLKF